MVSKFCQPNVNTFHKELTTNHLKIIFIPMKRPSTLNFIQMSYTIKVRVQTRLNMEFANLISTTSLN
jgi:hypothetical protein